MIVKLVTGKQLWILSYKLLLALCSKGTKPQAMCAPAA